MRQFGQRHGGQDFVQEDAGLGAAGQLVGSPCVAGQAKIGRHGRQIAIALNPRRCATVRALDRRVRGHQKATASVADLGQILRFCGYGQQFCRNWFALGRRGRGSRYRDSGRTVDASHGKQRIRRGEIGAQDTHQVIVGLPVGSGEALELRRVVGYVQAIAGSGECDIEKPTAFVGLVVGVRLLGVGVRRADVQHAHALLLKHAAGLIGCLAGSSVQEHDVGFQALGGMDREDLDRVLFRLQALHVALAAGQRLGAADVRGKQLDQLGQRRVLPRPFRLQNLKDMGGIGQGAFARIGENLTPKDAAVVLQRRKQTWNVPFARQRGPLPKPIAGRAGSLRVQARSGFGKVQVEESGQEGVRAQTTILGLGDGAQDPEDFQGLGRIEQLAAFVKRKRNSGMAQRLADGRALVVGEGENEDVARTNRRLSVGTAEQAQIRGRGDQRTYLIYDGGLQGRLHVGATHGLLLGGKPVDHDRRRQRRRGSVERPLERTAGHRRVVADAAFRSKKFGLLRKKKVLRGNQTLGGAKVAR